MHLFPHFDFFCYEKMQTNPGLYAISYPTGSCELFANYFIFDLIYQAIQDQPHKKIILSLEKNTQKELLSFLQKKQVENANLALMDHCEDFINWYKNISQEDQNSIAGLFVNNDNFFKYKSEISDSFQVAVVAKMIKTLNIVTPNLIKVITRKSSFQFSVHYRRSAPTTDLSSLHAAKSVIGIKMYDKSKATFTCLKDSSGVPDIDINVKFDADKNLIIHQKNEKNFFKYKDPHALMTIQSRRILTDIKDSYTFFDQYNITKSVKKIVLAKSIKEKQIKGTNNKYVSINYNYINLLLIAKEVYQDSFDPNFFCRALVEEFAFKIPHDEYKSDTSLFIEFLRLAPQKYFYEWLNKSNEGKLKDTFNMYLELKEKKATIITANAKKLQQLHDHFVSLLDSLNPTLNQRLELQENLILWNNHKIKIINNEIEEVLTIQIPLKNRDLITVGNIMKLCISNNWFWNNLERNGHCIVVLKNENFYRYCIEIDSEANITEAKSSRNEEIEPFIMDQLQDILFNIIKKDHK